MKSFIVLFAIFAMVLVDMPVIADEPAGPPGYSTEACIGSQMFEMAAQVVKEVTPIDLDAVAVSTYANGQAFAETVSPNASAVSIADKYINDGSVNTKQPFYLAM
jgi:hypothetical protein